MLVLDTIVGLATPRMTSALALVRLSGTKAIEIFNNLIKRDAFSLEHGKAYLFNLRKYDGTIIDNALVTIFKDGKSYTGFDTVEFSLHGNMLIVDELIDTLCHFGARLANKGEFSYQAHYNNKISLLQSEKINELIHSKSLVSKNLALGGVVSRDDNFINDIKNSILKISASLEYIIEDELDLETYDDESKSTLSSKLNNIKNSLDKIYEATKKSTSLFSGIKICLVGKPNVGKSSLLNNLIKEDKAIVTSIAGTTRDIVEGERIYKDILFKIYDTAGIRKSRNKIEQIGISKSLSKIDDADVVLFLSDKDFVYLDELVKEHNINLENKLVLKVGTKKDIKNTKGHDIQISNLENPDVMIFDTILEKLELNNVREITNHLTQRELSYLKKISASLEEVIKSIEVVDLSLVANDLISIVDIFNEMLGESKGSTKEEIYDTIFSNFCMGK